MFIIDSEKHKALAAETEGDDDSQMNMDDGKVSTSLQQEATKSNNEPRLSKKCKSETDDEEEKVTDDERALTNCQNATKGVCGPKQSQEQRQEELESDEWAAKVEPCQLLCKGCCSWVVLSKSQDFKTKDWEVHKKKCVLITGTFSVWTCTATKRIAAFFKKKDQSPSPIQESKSLEPSDLQLLKITYKTKKLPMVNVKDCHNNCTTAH